MVEEKRVLNAWAHLAPENQALSFMVSLVIADTPSIKYVVYQGYVSIS